jgi:hypothetical protein
MTRKVPGQEATSKVFIRGRNETHTGNPVNR